LKNVYICLFLTVLLTLIQIFSELKKLEKDIKHGKTKIKPADLLKAQTMPTFCQVPVMVVPSKLSSLETCSYPVCFTCGPPAAPDKPFVVDVGTTTVTIQWVNPMFDGVAPVKYHLYMRSNTRNFR
jgi:hypothetical protein